jgi:hypothetical protein
MLSRLFFRLRSVSGALVGCRASQPVDQSNIDGAGAYRKKLCASACQRVPPSILDIPAVQQHTVPQHMSSNTATGEGVVVSEHVRIVQCYVFQLVKKLPLQQ